MKRSLLFLAVLALMGCTSAEEVRQKNAALDDETCRSYGLTFGTPEYAQCRQNIANQRSANARAALGLLLLQQQNQPATYIPQPQPQAPVRMTTTCNTVGNATYCQ
jgi:hypothetical protein